MTVVPADGVILDRVREALPLISSEGLSRQAYSKLDTALLRPRGLVIIRRFALVDGAEVLASATRYDLAAVLDQRPVRVRGIGEIFTQPADRTGGPARELVDHLLDEAERDGTAIPLVRESAPFYKRSSHVNPSSAARGSARGSLAASYRLRSRSCRRSPRQKC